MKKSAKVKKMATARPTATKKPANKISTTKKSANNGVPERNRRPTYTPGPIQGTGWPPFRYPLQ